MADDSKVKQCFLFFFFFAHFNSKRGPIFAVPVLHDAKGEFHMVSLPMRGALFSYLLLFF